MTQLFENINEEDKKSLLYSLNAIVSTFPSNTQVFHYNNDNVIGVVDEGIVQIIRNDYNGDRVLIEELKKNQIFGSHISSITSQDFEVISISPCKITFFDFDAVYSNEIKENKAIIQFQENLLKIMSDIILKRNGRIQVLCQKTIRERLLEYFKMVSKKQMTKNITIPFNYTELADYLGINRSAMYRELNNLKAEKQIAIKKKIISLYFYF